MTPNPLERKLNDPDLLARLATARDGRRYATYSFGAEGEIRNADGEPTPAMDDLKVFMQELRDLVAPFAHAVRGTIFVGEDLVHLMYNLQPAGVSDLKLPSIDIHWMPPMPERDARPEEDVIPGYRICTFDDTRIQIPSLSDLVMILSSLEETVKLLVEDEELVPGYVRLIETLGVRIPIPADGATQFSISSMNIERI